MRADMADSLRRARSVKEKGACWPDTKVPLSRSPASPLGRGSAENVADEVCGMDTMVVYANTAYIFGKTPIIGAMPIKMVKGLPELWANDKGQPTCDD